MRVRRTLTSQVVTLTDAALLGAGGEARVYRMPDDPTLVAKIWHKPTAERAAKVGVMLSNPPLDPMAQQQHTSIAWPVDILQSPTGNAMTVGFLMPYVGGMRPIIDFFNPKTRRQKCPLFSWFYLHRTARNLVIALRALHDRGYVVGDLNESNVLVAETALVSVVDTDSFQVWDATKGKVYRCRVGKPEFTPPELQGKAFGNFNRNIEHDLFGLGIILFQLLMEGTHPFAGTYTGQGDAPPYEARIASGHFPYASGAPMPYAPKRTAPPLGMLYPSLQHLFVRCFQDGHFQPTARPDTQAWQWALEEAESALVSCWFNDQHVYSSHMAQCPWCERAKLLGGRDPFPSLDSVKAGTHLGPVVPPPRTRGRPHPVASAGSRNLPPPPVPRGVPATSGSASRQQTGGKPFAGFPGPRNDLAWTGLVLAGMSLLFIGLAPGFSYFLGSIGFLCALFGEIRSHGWYLDGKGQIPARIAMALSGILVLVFFYKNVPVLE